MGHTLLGVLSLFLLNTLFHCGHLQDAELTLEPNSSHLFVGESVTFTCDMREGNDTDWLYTFNWNGQQIASASSSAHSLYLTADLSGDYQCTGRRKVSTTMTKQSNTVTLSVSAQRPTATMTADRTTIPIGGTVTLTCSVEDSAGWKYDWFSRISDSYEALIATNVVQNFLSVSDEGVYWCCGRRGNSVFFTENSEEYHIEKTLSNKTTITLQHNWTQIFSGEKITIRCEIQGGDDNEWQHEWRTTSSNTPPTQSEYSISSASASYSGKYWCKGRRDLYSSTKWSDAITLTVSSHKPRPIVMADRRTIPVGGNVTLTCSGVSSAEWRYYWFRHTSDFSESEIIRDGGPSQVISISQGGIYHCKGGRGNPVFFTEGSDAVIIEKRVSSKAVVSLQPNWPLIFSGERITVRCEIYGSGNPQWEYEWSKPNSNTAPTYNEYRIVNASVSSSGNYRCMGKHKLDLYSLTEWSDVTALTVSAHRPQANISANNRAFLEGDSVALTCSVKPSSSGWSYFWYGGKKTSEPLTTHDGFHHDEQIRVSQDGLYRCRGGRGNPVYYTEYSDSISINKIATTRPVVSLHPSWPVIYRGEAITLRCDIQGGDKEWHYEWTTTSVRKPSNQNEYRISSASPTYNGYYWCKGRMKSAQQNSTGWSASFELTVPYDKPKVVLTASPSWLSPGASVTLKCEIEYSSAGWRFYWYKAVPQVSGVDYPYGFGRRHWINFHRVRNWYRYEPLPGSSSGTEQDLYIVRGQTHTAGYVCRAGRGDPVYYTDYSEPKFAWSGDLHSAASLTVSPDRVQHFTSDPVSLACEGNSTDWRVRRFPDDDYLSDMSYQLDCPNHRRMTTFTCNLYSPWYSDAVYWCESGSGEFSNAVNITGHNPAILVSPVHPVSEGETVTLGCKLRTENLLPTVAFYKNGKLIQKGDRQELNISAASKSDEGFYKCECSGHESAESWMSVRSSSSSLNMPLIVGLVSGILLTVLSLLLFCWCRKDAFCNGLTRSQRTSQTSATVQTVNPDGNQQQIYSSLLHGDACVYESIRGSGNTADAGRADMYRNVISQVELRGVGQRRKRNDPGESSDYHNVNPDSATEP